MYDADRLRAQAREYWARAERAVDRKTRLMNLLIAAHYLDRADAPLRSGPGGGGGMGGNVVLLRRR